MKTSNAIEVPNISHSNMYLCVKELSFVKDLEVGKKYRLMIEVKNKGMRIEEMNGKNEVHVDMEVMKAKEIKGKDGMYDEKTVEKAKNM